MNGIGGRTIAEAKLRISFPEFKAWAAYRNKRGSLHPGMRTERGAALLATLYANRHRNESVLVKSERTRFQAAVASSISLGDW